MPGDVGAFLEGGGFEGEGHGPSFLGEEGCGQEDDGEKGRKTGHDRLREKRILTANQHSRRGEEIKDSPQRTLRYTKEDTKEDAKEPTKSGRWQAGGKGGWYNR